MTSLRNTLVVLLAFSLVLIVGAGCSQKQNSESTSSPEAQADVDLGSSDSDEGDVPYVPTPPDVVEKMLELADVTEDDVVYDLGSGDGRIVIAAAEKYGARGVGIEIDSQRVAEARKNAREAGVANLVEFRRGNLFEADISEATAVTLYLLPTVNLKLRPKLFEELEPGTPVVSHDFDMDDWTPDTTVEVGSSTVYRWTIPDEVPAHLRE